MTLRMQILFMTISLVQISCEWETKQMCVSNVHPSLHHFAPRKQALSKTNRLVQISFESDVEQASDGVIKDRTLRQN